MKMYEVLERDAFSGRFRKIYETSEPNKFLLKKMGKIGGLKGKPRYKFRLKKSPLRNTEYAK